MIESVARTLDASTGTPLRSAAERASHARLPNYTAVMADELDRASRREDERVVAITAGMPTGTGVAAFGERSPTRIYDVGIAEQHAMTLATGMALAGQRPFVALYSTFLQRAFDQVVHDVCQNDAPVVIGIDRAGLVGEDGTSHQGMFMLPALRQLPNLVIAAPRDEQQLRRLAAHRVRPAAPVRHPVSARCGFGLPAVDPVPVEVGRGETLREGSRHPHRRLRAHRGARHGGRRCDSRAEGWSVGVMDARFAEPLDHELIPRAPAASDSS